MITAILALLLLCSIFAYFPLLLVVFARDRTRIMRRRPINEILNDALAEGRMTEEEWSRRMDEVHRSMPSLDAPYPKAREFEEHKL